MIELIKSFFRFLRADIIAEIAGFRAKLARKSAERAKERFLACHAELEAVQARIREIEAQIAQQERGE
jgi:hypothetical protein